MNSQFGSDESAGSMSTPSTLSSLQSQDQPMPTIDLGSGGGLGAAELDLASYYTNTPSPSRSKFAAVDIKSPASPRDTFGNVPKVPAAVKIVTRDEEVHADESFVDLERDDDDIDFEGQGWNDEGEEEEEGTWDTLKGNMASALLNANAERPKIVISEEPLPPNALTESIPLPTPEGTSSMPHTPLTPGQRYPGWLSGVVKPLAPFIDEAIEPRDHYVELQEIAEGESGSIFAARINPTNAEKLRLHPNVKNRDSVEVRKGTPALVAVKIIAITPLPSAGKAETQKLIDLERELKLMKGLWHENILGLDALYVDLTEDTLWVRMELMERSLADIVGLVVDGLMLQDRMIARFAQDVSFFHALFRVRLSDVSCQGLTCTSIST
jgi:hypothetical protein